MTATPPSCRYSAAGVLTLIESAGSPHSEPDDLIYH